MSSAKRSTAWPVSRSKNEHASAEQAILDAHYMARALELARKGHVHHPPQSPGRLRDRA